MKRILVAEDDARVAGVLADLLSREGYETILVPDGRAALDRLGAEPIDLLILDINMPGLGGASLVELLRNEPEQQRFAALPIIIVSAMWGVVSFDLDIQAGFPKPIPFPALLAKVRDLIGPA